VIWIAGAGAMGTALARAASAAGADTRLFGRHSSIPGTIEARELWITCKRGSTEALLEAWKSPIVSGGRADLRVIFIQNGLGISELAARHLGARSWTRAALWWGARLEGADLILTPPPRRMAFAGDCDAVFWRRCGFEVETLAHSDRDALEWRKALTNLTLNALLALHGAPNGALLAQPELLAEAQLLHDEARAVAERLGIAVGGRTDTWAEVVRTAEATPNNRNSLLQDIEAGRETELEWLNTTLLARARSLGIALPHHEKLVSQLRPKLPGPAAGI
jgi:2-dehydropantoate 2-reductase